MEQTVVSGVNKLLDYGIAVCFMVLAGIACFYLVKYLLQRCDAKFDKALDMHQSMSTKFANVVDKNTDVISLVLAEMRNSPRPKTKNKK